jgi:hypothetical protein
MKAGWLLAFPTLACSVALAQEPTLNELGTAFRRPDLDVRWRAPAKALPATLWTYQVSDGRLSPEVVSNLMAVGPFTDKDETNRFLHPSDDPKRVRYALTNGRSLEFFPSIGAVEYQDSAAEQMEITEGVPAEKDMLEKARAFLPKLGIKESELATKPHSADLLVYFTFRQSVLYDKTNQPYTTNIYSRGVYFIRRVDGVDFLGIGVRGGCRIDFGNHGQIARISLLWRKLERGRAYDTVMPETLIKWVQNGKGVLSPLRDDILPFDWTAVKSLTVTNVVPYLFGERSRAIQKEVYPFATLYGVVDTGQTNVAVEIECPVIDESKR